MSQCQLETLKFKIGLSSTQWNNKPEFAIKLNNEVKVKGQLDPDLAFYEFTADIEEEQEHSLEISLLNKTNRDTIVESDGSISKDMILNIESIEVDDIELGLLKWTNSVFEPQDPSRPVLNQCVNLGWNGTWKMQFTSPFYLWLLENM